jgi:hypothetical protein
MSDHETCQVIKTGATEVRLYEFGKVTDEGHVTGEEHYRDGKLHREGGPAVVWHYANGLTIEDYYRDGERHRESGPAHFMRFVDGATEESYFRNGKLHCMDGPAYIRHDANGTVIGEMYCLYGVEMPYSAGPDIKARRSESKTPETEKSKCLPPKLNISPLPAQPRPL